MYYASHPRDLVIYPFIPMMAGFYLHHKFGGIDGFMVGFFLEVLGLYIAYLLSPRYINEFKTEPEPAPVVKINNMGVAYNYEVEGVKINKGQQVAQTIFSQYKGGLNVDLTERYWVGSKKFTRTEWIALLDEWKKYGLIEKGWRKNSPYTVKDWHRVAHLVATGRMKRQ